MAITERIVTRVRRAASITAGTLGLVLLALLAPGRGFAHGLDPASLALREIAPGVFDVVWQASALRLPGTNVQPALPAHCHRIGTPQAIDGGDRITLRWRIDCGPAGIPGATIAIEDLAAAKINGLLRIERRDLPPIQTVLSPSRPSFVVPTQPQRWDLVREYGTRGLQRILTRPDHLLFVFGLLLLAWTSRRLPQTIAAFTLGHSLTLAAAALGLAALSQRSTELLIAGSVLILAVALAHDPERKSLLRRCPWAAALLFGSLHGFGFAAGLTDAGLPARDVPLALLSFNVGIELGQLAFVAAVLTLGAGAARGLPAVVPRAIRPTVYAIGILAAFWCYERLALWVA